MGKKQAKEKFQTKAEIMQRLIKAILDTNNLHRFDISPKAIKEWNKQQKVNNKKNYTFRDYIKKYSLISPTIEQAPHSNIHGINPCYFYTANTVEQRCKQIKQAIKDFKKNNVIF